MSSWFSSNLGDALLADESLAHIKAIFLSELEQAKSTNDMAIFFRHESLSGLHCEVKVYFSPAAIMVAEAVDATPCNQPSLDGLGLLVGSPETWNILFPQNVRFSQ